jgi:hypothetical protein
MHVWRVSPCRLCVNVCGNDENIDFHVKHIVQTKGSTNTYEDAMQSTRKTTIDVDEIVYRVIAK